MFTRKNILKFKKKKKENLDKSLVNFKKHVKILFNDNSLYQDHQESNAIKLLQKYKTKLVQMARLSEELNIYSNSSSELITKVSKFPSKNVNYPDHPMMQFDSKSDYILQDMSVDEGSKREPGSYINCQKSITEKLVITINLFNSKIPTLIFLMTLTP